MRALFLNWRCPKHPKAGGAEYVTMQLAQALLKQGWEVVWFSAWADGLAREEVLDGVRMVRAGGPLTVQGAARRWYKKQPKGYFDFVLDQSHGLPFFAPAWVKEPCMYFIHEVTGRIALYMVPWPFGWLYKSLEPLIIKFYAKTPALTISNSTYKDMVEYGMKAPVTVLTLGLDTKPVAKLPSWSQKEQDLTVVMAARLVPLKRPDEAIKMMSHLVKRQPRAKLWVLGSGKPKYIAYLQRLAAQLGLTKNVRFFGYVSYEKRKELMARAHFLTITSVKEGWGLTVPESNAVGTVAVTYNIAGVRDSNHDGETGLLAPHNTPADLATTIDALFNDQKRYAKLQRAAWEWSKTLQWSKPQNDFVAVVNKLVKN